MKKVLLLSLSLLLGLGAFAQRQVTQRIMKDDAKKVTVKHSDLKMGKEAVTAVSDFEFTPQAAQSVVTNRNMGLDECETMWTNYDLQSNHFVANRMFMTPEGGVAVTATWSHQSNTTASDRGTGYNFYTPGDDWDSDWLDQPEARVEPFKTGWPTIAQWGETGEMLIAHGGGNIPGVGTVPSGLQCFTREVAGEGEWVYTSTLPQNPEGYPYAGASDAYPTWARLATTGDNHNVAVVVAAIQHSISSDESVTHDVYFRSEDGVNWTCSYGPLGDLGLGYETGFFSADDYCIASNGHNVAIVYSGSMENSVWMFKSTDDGLTWSANRVWEDPYEGISLSDTSLVYTDTLFRPMNSAVTIDNNGVVHVALNTFEMAHQEDDDPGYYTLWYGRSVDGIVYWNDAQGGPLQSPDGNPHHAARLWWPAEESGYVHMIPDSTRWIGYIPMWEGYEWDNDKFYMYTNNKWTDYLHRFYGASGHMALSCDPFGNLACAFSTPCTMHEANGYYLRRIYVSYRNVDNGYWNQIVDDLLEDDMHNYDEAVFTISAPNVNNVGEYWFGYQADEYQGLFWGANSSYQCQASASTNYIIATRIIADPENTNVPQTEAKNVINGVYPNPATDYVVVNSAMEADATITFVNLVGQTVAQFNKHLNLGENSINFDLKSGIYFCTVKVNGFDKTIKVVVK